MEHWLGGSTIRGIILDFFRLFVVVVFVVVFFVVFVFFVFFLLLFFFGGGSWGKPTNSPHEIQSLCFIEDVYCCSILS